MCVAGADRYSLCRANRQPRTSMRILHVTPYWADAWAYGGIPRVAGALVRHQAGAGHRVTVCTTDAHSRDSRRPAAAAPEPWRCRSSRVSESIESPGLRLAVLHAGRHASVSARPRARVRRRAHSRLPQPARRACGALSRSLRRSLRARAERHRARHRAAADREARVRPAGRDADAATCRRGDRGVTGRARAAPAARCAGRPHPRRAESDRVIRVHAADRTRTVSPARGLHD